MNKYLTWLLSILLFSASYLASAQSEPVPDLDVRIINGEETEQGNWPYVAALVSTVFDRKVECGATFLGGRYVLTSRGCGQLIIYHSPVFDDYPYEVVIEGNDLSDINDGQRVSINNVYVYDGDDSIAVIELTKEIEAETVTLADEALIDHLSNGDSVKLLGWGRITNSSPFIYPSKLHQIDVPFVDLPTCQNLGEEYSLISEGQLCAGESTGGEELCNKDVGGPLLYNDNGVYKQIGIASWGSGCDHVASGYSVYTNVAKYSDWIAVIASGVSYKQLIFSYSQKQTVQFIIPLANYGTQPFHVTDFNLPTGITMVDNHCSSALEPGSSCSVVVEVDRAATDMLAIVMGQRISLDIMTDHPLVPVFKVTLYFSEGYSYDLDDSDSSSSANSSSGSGGASFYLILVMMFGLVFRRR